ncbi:heterokaryon incompatibility protein-domain-containing protein, partial [Staphylotrichum tortipilum]
MAASSTNSTTLEYKQVVLPSAATHIRLIQLFCFPTTESSSGGSYDAPLKCRMFSASLERPPPFVALSYTWGNSKEERQLHVSAGGHHAQGPDPDPSSATSFGHLAITPSLDEALRHIRKAQKSDSVTLWVDQICIDQRNTLEKNAQVAAMGTIYGRATQVLVWLGCSTPDSDAFIDRMTAVGSLAREQDVERYFDPAKRTDEEFWQFMSKVVADSGTNADTGGQCVSDDDKFETFLRGASDALFGNGGSKKEVAAQLRAWLDRPWFSRVWVLQEYSLAAESPVFLCGDKTIAAELFSLAHTVIMMTFPGSRSAALLPQGETNLAQSELMDAALDSCLGNLARLRRHCQPMPADNKGDGDAYSLGELVQDLYSADTPLMLATDPRDRIFALLNLCTDADGLGISPDYADGQTVDLVYTRAARAILGAEGGIRLLELLRFPKTIVGHETAAKRLPSWVPDFYHHNRSFSRSVAEASKNQWLYAPAGDARKAEIIHNPNGDERILTLNGIFVDTISLTGEAWNGAIPAGSKDVNPGLYLRYFTEVEKLCGIPSHQSGLPSDKQPREELVYRVMLGDVAYQPNS